MEVLESGKVNARLVFVYDVGVVGRVFVFAGRGLVLLRQQAMVVASSQCQRCAKEKLFHD